MLAGLARGPMRAKHGALAEALTGMFEDHHGELAQLLLDQIAFLDARITQLTTRISEHARGDPGRLGYRRRRYHRPGRRDQPRRSGAGRGRPADEIPGISAELAASIIAETGLDMTRFPTAAHLVSWAGLCPRQPVRPPHPARQNRPGRHLPARLPRPGRHRRRPHRHLPGRALPAHRPPPRQAKAQVAVARSILVIIWHLLADPAARYTDLGPGHHETRSTRTGRPAATSASSKPLGYTVTITPRPPDPYHHARALPG